MVSFNVDSVDRFSFWDVDFGFCDCLIGLCYSLDFDLVHD